MGWKGPPLYKDMIGCFPIAGYVSWGFFGVTGWDTNESHYICIAAKMTSTTVVSAENCNKTDKQGVDVIDKPKRFPFVKVSV